MARGLFYYESKPYYGLIVPLVVPAVLLAFGVVCSYLSTDKVLRTFGNLGGLAKETAHQLGTPISSLLAWTELLHERSKETTDSTLTELAESMQNDLGAFAEDDCTLRYDRHPPPRTEVNLDDIFQEVQTYLKNGYRILAVVLRFV